MEKEKIKITEIDYGIACRVGNEIFINKELSKHPILYSAIVNHELEHSPGFNFNDIKLDINNKHLKGLKLQYYWFILSNPKAFVEFLPCWRYNNRLVWNPLILGLYGLFLALFGGMLWLLS